MTKNSGQQNVEQVLDEMRLHGQILLFRVWRIRPTEGRTLTYETLHTRRRRCSWSAWSKASRTRSRSRV